MFGPWVVLPARSRIFALRWRWREEREKPREQVLDEVAEMIEDVANKMSTADIEVLTELSAKMIAEQQEADDALAALEEMAETRIPEVNAETRDEGFAGPSSSRGGPEKFQKEAKQTQTQASSPPLELDRMKTQNKHKHKFNNAIKSKKQVNSGLVSAT